LSKDTSAVKFREDPIISFYEEKLLTDNRQTNAGYYITSLAEVNKTRTKSIIHTYIFILLKNDTRDESNKQTCTEQDAQGSGSTTAASKKETANRQTQIVSEAHCFHLAVEKNHKSVALHEDSTRTTVHDKI